MKNENPNILQSSWVWIQLFGSAFILQEKMIWTESHAEQKKKKNMHTDKHVQHKILCMIFSSMNAVPCQHFKFWKQGNFEWNPKTQVQTYCLLFLHLFFFFLHKGFGSIMYLWPSYIGFININTKWCNFTLGKGSSIYQRVILMCLRFYFTDSCISLTHVNSNQLCAHCERHAYLWRFQIMHYVGITHTHWLKKNL